MKTTRSSVLASFAALLAAVAVAGEPAPAGPSTLAAPATVSVPLVSQDALLARQAHQDRELFVLDVRTPAEFAAGHVPNAANVPHDQLAARLSEVPRDKDIVVYCRSGRRAAIAQDLLLASGYERVSHLEGDMNAWQANARPIEK